MVRTGAVGDTSATGVPFLFLTAYSLDSVPAEHRSRPFLQKPHRPGTLIHSVAELIGIGKPVGREMEDRL